MFVHCRAMVENSSHVGPRVPRALAVLALLLMALPLGSLRAQPVESFDPDAVYAQEIDGDLVETREPPSSQPEAEARGQNPAQTAPGDPAPRAPWAADETSSAAQDRVASQTPATPDEVTGIESSTYGKDDLIGVAQGVFGSSAKGIAGVIEKLLKEQGEPNAYIVGREAGGAIVVGLRYGSGTLHHKVEGERKVYWTGPSIGFDAGANAGETFVLVYNLHDTEDLFKRFPAGEGQAYFVGGFHVSYLRRGDIVLIPIRVGAGLRLGVNAGYMKFSKKQRWLPF